MVAIPKQRDLREPLARALSIRLVELDCRPSITTRLCAWLARLPDAVVQIDGGQCYVVVSPAAFIPKLYSLPEAQAATAEAPMPEMVAVDLRPVLAWLRGQLSEQN